LLVQGPLVAVLLMDLLKRYVGDAVVRSLEFKAVRPSFVGRPLQLCGRPQGDAVQLWASDDEGRLTMTATAEVEP
jgi:3-methylfumaryl-CoA hydratase